MRYSSLKQENMYQEYSDLSREIIRFSEFHQDENENLKKIWALVSEKGIWKLSISKQYGGDGLSWQDSLIAIDGLFSGYLNVRLLSMVVSQVSAIYLVAEYGSELVKKQYLPRIINGEFIHFFISNFMKKSFSKDLFSHELSNIPLNSEKNKLMIFIKKRKYNVTFSIIEKKYNEIREIINKKCSIYKFIFIQKEKGLFALHALINFQRILVGILSNAFIQRISVNTRNN